MAAKLRLPSMFARIRKIMSGVAALALLMIMISAPAYADSVTLTPGSLTICEGGGTGTFTVTHGGGGQSQFAESASSNAPTIATVSPASQTTSGAGKVTPPFTVTGVATGSTSIHVSDTNTSGNLPVNVNGPISVNQTSMTFTTGATQNITVTDPGPNILVSGQSSNTGVATVTASATTSANTATLTVTPVSRGTATITITDAANCASKTVSVTVNAGPLTVSKSSITLNGSGSNTTFTASETNYTGAINAASSNTNVVTVSPATASGPGPDTYTVTAAGTQFGPATVNVTDDHSGSQPVNVVVTGGTISASGGTAVIFTASDNTHANLAATTASIAVTGSVQSTTTGSANISVQSPADYTGTHGGAFHVAYLSYTCANNGGTGGAFASGFLSLVASGTSSPCWSLGANAFASLNFNLNLFLDDRALPADTYSTHSGFSILLTAS